MSKLPVLWDNSTRKEVYDVLVDLWPQLDDPSRSELVDRITAGPPAFLTDHLPVADREHFRARRIFERLRIMQRADATRPHAGLDAALAHILEQHPGWIVAPGEQAHFAIFSQFGQRTLGAPDDTELLSSMSPEEVIAKLLQDERERVLEAWSDVAASDWAKMTAVLEGVAEQRGPDPELWATTLSGLRTRAASPLQGESVLDLIADLEPSLAQNPSVASAAAYLLESSASSSQFKSAPLDDFWRAFDAVALGVSLDEANVELPDDGDWISLSINTSMGNIALAFINAMFALRLVVGGGIPSDLRERFVWLIGQGSNRHRPARVVLASRLSYLFAIDPELTRSHLLPSFRWSEDESEATAVWQGFGWQPHLDPLLWAEIKSDILGCFAETRIARFGRAGESLAQVIAAAGIQPGFDDLPRQATQMALRRMPSQTRADMLQWLAGAITSDGEQGANADVIWEQKIKPWIQKFWPRDPMSHSASEVRPWVEIALATNDTFEDAVETIRPFIRRSDSADALRDLAGSPHPDSHPRAALRLMGSFLSPDTQFWSFDDLSRVLDTVVEAEPALRDNPIYVQWSEFRQTRL